MELEMAPKQTLNPVRRELRQAAIHQIEHSNNELLATNWTNDDNLNSVEATLVSTFYRQKKQV